MTPSSICLTRNTCTLRVYSFLLFIWNFMFQNKQQYHLKYIDLIFGVPLDLEEEKKIFENKHKFFDNPFNTIK